MAYQAAKSWSEGVPTVLEVKSQREAHGSPDDQACPEHLQEYAFS